MYAVDIAVTNKNGTKNVTVNQDTCQDAAKEINQIISELFGKNGGNNRELMAVSTLVNLSESGYPDGVVLMQLRWNLDYRLWEIWYENYEEFTDRFVSFDAAIHSFCQRVLPIE